MAKQIAFDIIARDKASKTFAKIGGAAKLLGVVGLGSVVANAVQTEAQFSKTMNIMQATSGASGKEMDKLRSLAVKMGADTQFSAGAAAEAMLELARGGIKPAQIQAGALAGTLTLAAAGQLEMGEAANVAVKSMGQFGLKGKDMNAIGSALAGGANASSASVRDMSFALAQGGLAANSVGFSIQETTAVLAAFSNAGLEGSDAGTAMKTMLDRLQPTTNSAKAAMMGLGAWSEKTGSAFVKSNGQFKSAAQIAEILHKGTKKLGEAERKRLITQAFGSDAQRAATIFAKEGAAGLNKLKKATSDQKAVQDMANASMKGTGGALEKMKGSLETASLAIGTMLAPAVVFLADKVGAAANAFVEFSPKIKAAGNFVKDNETTFKALGVTIVAVMAVTKLHTAAMAVQAAGGLLPLLKATKLVSSATKAYAAVQWALNAAHLANPVGLFVLALVALAAAVVIAWKKSDIFKKALLTLGIVGVKSFRFLVNAALSAFGGILTAAEKGLGWIPGIGPKIKKAKEALDNFKDKTVANLDKAAAALQRVVDKIDKVKSPPPIKVTILTKDAAATLGAFGAQLGKLPKSKTIKIYTNYLTTGRAPKTNTNLFGVPGNARGTSFWRGGATWLHEQGPEIVDLPRGSRVYPAGESARMAREASGGKGGGGVTLNLSINGFVGNESQLGRELERVLNKHFRAGGRPSPFGAS